ncbi:ankyrin repeat domain-containing protein, partial [Candidatus Pacearchaeota archaeon]|nr:ankyrin repeat domain-containing protein [Candidatus Pacearchaeota archaeon]
MTDLKQIMVWILAFTAVTVLASLGVAIAPEEGITFGPEVISIGMLGCLALLSSFVVLVLWLAAMPTIHTINDLLRKYRRELEEARQLLLLLSAECGRKFKGTLPKNLGLVDEHDRNALHWAAKNGDLDLVLRLIKRKMSCILKDANGDTPLSLAIKAGHIDISDALMDADAMCALSIYGGGGNILHWIARKKSKASGFAIQIAPGITLMGEPLMNLQDMQTGMCIFYIAKRYPQLLVGTDDIAKIPLEVAIQNLGGTMADHVIACYDMTIPEMEADYRADCLARPCLFLAIQQGGVPGSFLKALVGMGFDLSALDSHGYTLLARAVFTGDEYTVSCVMSLGGDPRQVMTLVDEVPITAIGLAKSQKGAETIFKMLENKAALLDKMEVCADMDAAMSEAQGVFEVASRASANLGASAVEAAMAIEEMHHTDHHPEKMTEAAEKSATMEEDRSIAIDAIEEAETMVKLALAEVELLRKERAEEDQESDISEAIGRASKMAEGIASALISMRSGVESVHAAKSEKKPESKAYDGLLGKNTQPPKSAVTPETSEPKAKDEAATEDAGDVYESRESRREPEEVDGDCATEAVAKESPESAKEETPATSKPKKGNKKKPQIKGCVPKEAKKKGETADLAVETLRGHVSKICLGLKFSVVKDGKIPQLHEDVIGATRELVSTATKAVTELDRVCTEAGKNKGGALIVINRLRNRVLRAGNMTNAIAASEWPTAKMVKKLIATEEETPATEEYDEDTTPWVEEEGGGGEPEAVTEGAGGDGEDEGEGAEAGGDGEEPVEESVTEPGDGDG